MKKSFLAYSLSAFFISLSSANALFLTDPDTNDFSAWNAQVTCDASDVCTFAPIDTSQAITIDSDQLSVNGTISGVSAFVFPADDGAGNDYLATGATPDTSYALFSFAATVMDSITINGDVTNTVGYGVAIWSGANIADSITVGGDITGVSVGLILQNVTAGAFDFTGTAAGSSRNISFQNVDVTNALNVGGTLSTGAIGTYFDTVTADSMDISSTITSTDSSGAGIYFNATTVTGLTEISGTLSITNQAIYAVGLTTGSLDISGSVTSTSGYGAILQDSVIGTTTISGSLVANSHQFYLNNTTVDDLIVSGSMSGTGLADAIVLYGTSSVTNAITINEGATVYGGRGIYVVSTASLDTVINNGSIQAITGYAININDAADNTLNYSGNGTMTGSYHIRMAGGTDTLNITNSDMIYPKLSEVEIVNASDSTFNLDLTEVNNPDALIDATGTTDINLTTVLFNLNHSAGDLVIEDRFTLLAVDTITMDALSIDFGVVSFDTTGYFDIYDNEGTDELQYILGVKDNLWAVGVSENLLTDARVHCGGASVCELQPMAGDTITLSSDSFIMRGNKGAQSFVMGSGDTDNPYVITGTSGSSLDALLEFDGTSTNTVSLTVDISNTFGQGLSFYNSSSITGNFVYDGDIVSEGISINVDDLIVSGTSSFTGSMQSNATIGTLDFAGFTTGTLSVDADIINTNYIGFYLNGGDITNSSTFNGTVVSEDVAIWLNDVRSGSVAVHSALTSNTDIGFNIQNFDVTNSIVVDGVINSDLTGVVMNTGDVGSVSVTSDITSVSGYGISMSSVNATDSVEIGGTINSSNFGVSFNTVTADSFILSADIVSSNHGVYLNDSSLGDLDISGTIDALYTGIYFYTGSLESFTSTADITAGNINTGISFTEVDVNGVLDFSGSITDSSSGIGLSYVSADSINVSTSINVIRNGSSFYNVNIAGDVNLSADIIATDSGMIFNGVDVAGTIINSGSIVAGASPTGDGALEQTYGMIIAESDINMIENTAVGVISGQYGIGFTKVYQYPPSGRDTSLNDQDLTIVNNGSIIGTTYAAISLDFTEEHYGEDSYDNVLTYSGFGTLHGAVVDIDMNGGNDTLNIVNATMSMPTMASVENVNISSSVIKLDLNDANKESILIDTTSAQNLSLSNVLFDVSVDVTSLDSAVGSQLVLMEVDGITANLSSLGISFDDLTISSKGNFKIIDNAGMDQLVFVWGGEPTLGADQGTVQQTDLAGVVSMSSLSNAMMVNISILNVVKDRMNSYNHAYLKNRSYEFANASNIQSDIHSVFKDMGHDNFGMWMQLFGHIDSYDGVVDNSSILSIGYDSTTYGVTFGYDSALTKTWSLGVATSYANGKIEGAADSFTTNSKSAQLNLYTSYLGDSFFIDAIAGYGFGLYEQERNTGTDIAVSDYYSSQLSGQLNIGTVFFIEHNILFTPYAKAMAFSVRQGSYEESDSVNALSVSDVEMQSLQGGGGFEIGYVFESHTSQFMPSIYFEYATEFGDVALPIQTSLVGSGNPGSSITTPDMGTEILRGGAGLSWISKRGNFVSLNYEHEIRDNYVSHGVFLKGKLLF